MSLVTIDPLVQFQLHRHHHQVAELSVNLTNYQFLTSRQLFVSINKYYIYFNTTRTSVKLMSKQHYIDSLINLYI